MEARRHSLRGSDPSLLPNAAHESQSLGHGQIFTPRYRIDEMRLHLFM
jgi:hypothetical protein